MMKAILGVALVAIVGAAAWWLLGGGEAHAPDGAILERRDAPKPAVGPEKPGIAGAAGGVRSVPFTDTERAAAEAEAATSRATGTESAADEVGPFIMGRVVDAARKPVPMADVVVRLGTQRAPVSRFLTADASGRFRTPVAYFTEHNPGVPDNFSVEVAPPHGMVLFDHVKKYELDRSEGFLKDRDVGDLQVDASRAVKVVVRDADGTPVARGCIARDEPCTPSFVPLDRDGSLVLFLPPAPVSIVLAAYGFERGRATIPADASSPFFVTLQRSATLEVRVRTPSGAPAPAVSVRLFGERGVVSFADMLKDALDTGERFETEADGRSVLQASFRTNAQGLVRVGDLIPAVPIKVEVTDPFSTFSWLYDVTPRAGEPFVIESRTSREPRTFSVLVRDANAKPVRNASLELAPIGSHRPGARRLLRSTGADGAASFADVYALEGALMVEAEALLKLKIDPFAFPGDGQAAVVVLKFGREIALEVVDPGGLPVPVEAAWAVHPDAGRSDGARNAADGRLVLKGLPEDFVTIGARIGDENFSLHHDARVAVARLVVPSFAKLAVRFSEKGTSKDRKVFVRLTPLAGDAPQRDFSPANDGDPISGDIAIAAIRTGKYRAELLRRNDQEPPTRIGASVDFVVESGRTNEILLSP